MSKKWITVLLGICLMLALLVGCGSEEVIAPAENSASQRTYSFSTYEQSPDITIDGILDENVWQGKGWFKNTYLSNIGSTMPSIEVTGFPTEYGVYIASVVYDQNLTCDGERYQGTNSNWELYVSACNAGEDLFSVKYNGAWTLKRLYIDMVSNANSWSTDFDRAVVVEGELNSSATTKATLEMFVPWATLGVDTSVGIPESFGILPCYRAVLQAGGSTSWMNPVDGNVGATTSAYLFDATGYINADKENSLLGDAYNGYAKSRGWDLTKIEEGSVEAIRGGVDKIFFKEYYGNAFIVEATVSPIKVINSANPMAGIVFQKTDGQSHTVMLSANNTAELSAMNGKYLTDSYYDGVSSSQTSISGYVIDGGVKLTVIKYGGSFWYFVGGKYVGGKSVVGMDGDCIPGLYTTGLDAIFTDYRCEAIDFEQLQSHLNNKGLYTVETSVDGAGGTITTNTDSLQAGESYKLSINTNSGYRLSSVMVNGKDIFADIRKNANSGEYIIRNVRENQKIVAIFESCDEVTYSGTITSNGSGLPSTLILENTQDRSLYYALSGSTSFEIKVPAGTYTVQVIAEGYKGFGKTVELTENITEKFVVEKSDFVSSLSVNGKNIYSHMDKYDLSLEYEGKVYGSRELGTRGSSLYFDGTGTDFVAQVTMNYTSDFSVGGKFQQDVLAGFNINDGTNNFGLWARMNGIVYTTGGWQYVMGIFPKEVLTYPSAREAVFAVAKSGEDVYIYLDGKQVYKTEWSVMASNMKADSEFAVGFNMWQDNNCEVEFSDYSITYDSDEVKAFIAAH